MPLTAHQAAPSLTPSCSCPPPPTTEASQEPTSQCQTRRSAYLPDRGTHGISVWLRCYSCLLAKPGPLSVFQINPIVVRLHRPMLALPSGTSPVFSICCLQDTLCLLFAPSPTTLHSRVERGASLLPSP